MKKVMIVEDDQTTKTLLTTLLKFEGFDICNSNEFQEQGILGDIQSHNPDLVLMDVHLRKGNGINLLQMIRSNTALDHLRVVMTSGEDYSYESRKFGADGFLMKPYMPDDLTQLIARLLAEPRAGNG